MGDLLRLLAPVGQITQAQPGPLVPEPVPGVVPSPPPNIHHLTLPRPNAALNAVTPNPNAIELNQAFVNAVSPALDPRTRNMTQLPIVEAATRLIVDRQNQQLGRPILESTRELLTTLNLPNLPANSDPFPFLVQNYVQRGGNDQQLITQLQLYSLAYRNEANRIDPARIQNPNLQLPPIVNGLQNPPNPQWRPAQAVDPCPVIPLPPPVPQTPEPPLLNPTPVAIHGLPGQREPRQGEERPLLIVHTPEGVNAQPFIDTIRRQLGNPPHMDFFHSANLLPGEPMMVGYSGYSGRGGRLPIGLQTLSENEARNTVRAILRSPE